jgi:uncharacterized membrane protein YhhN
VPFVVLVAVLTGLLLVAERRQSQLGKWLTKPAASAAFVALAYQQGALQTRYGTWIFGGLVLAALGDVLLIPKAVLPFRLGILSFLLGHVAFTVAFFVRGVAFPPFEGLLVVTLLVAFFVGRWLWPHAGELKGAVVMYIAVISVMVPAALATAIADAGGAGARSPGALIAVGAVAFYLSDLSVARDRFVKEGFVNRAWGLPLYYAAEVLLALSVSHMGS